MASMNELKTRVAGVKSTKQITHAMYLISASKSKRAKSKLEGVRPFFERVRATMSDAITAGGSEVFESPYIKAQNENGRTLCLVIGGDKGMAGGYNNNLIKFLRDNVDLSSTDLLVAGFMGRSRARQHKMAFDDEFRYPVMDPSLSRARDIARVIIDKYQTGAYKDVVIVYTTLVSALKQDPALMRVLPLSPDNFKQTAGRANELNTMLFEPSVVEVFDQLAPHYVKGLVYAAFVDSFTSEQHARMLAMDNATKSAEDIIATLSLKYNRARQAHITQEITEIVGGIPSE